MGHVLIFHLQLGLRLRRSGAIPFILHVFVACTGTTLPSLLFLENFIMRDDTLKCCNNKYNLTECENYYIKYISS
jgi:hypothetical protein